MCLSLSGIFPQEQLNKMNSDALNILDSIVEGACMGRRECYPTLAEWQTIKEVYSEKFPQLEKDVEVLRHQVLQLS